MFFKMRIDSGFRTSPVALLVANVTEIILPMLHTPFNIISHILTHPPFSCNRCQDSCKILQTLDVSGGLLQRPELGRHMTRPVAIIQYARTRPGNHTEYRIAFYDAVIIQKKRSCHFSYLSAVTRNPDRQPLTVARLAELSFRSHSPLWGTASPMWEPLRYSLLLLCYRPRSRWIPALSRSVNTQEFSASI